jgi:hypothetical protein
LPKVLFNVFCTLPKLKDNAHIADAIAKTVRLANQWRALE